MRQFKNGLLIGWAVVITGCAINGDYANVPVEDVNSRQGSVLEKRDYPAQSSPVQSGPAYGSPTRSSPTHSSPTHSSPTQNYPDSDDSYQKQVPDYGTPPSGSGNNAAIVALLDSAETQSRSGDYANAAATLERAIRISPRDPELYYQLAQVRYLQRNYHQTEQLCRKAISLASGNSPVLTRSRELMARAQQAN